MDYTLITYFIPFHDNWFLSGLTELFTIAAEDIIIILVGAFLYWCIDPRQGQRMACVAVGGVFWTLGLKNYLKVPRPWQKGIIAEKDVLRIHTATGYSFPSGHTTAGTNIYGYFAKGARRLWVKILLWSVVALIGLSRIYLGCHTSYDVLAAIGISVVWIYLGTWLFDKLVSKNDWFVFLFAIPLLFAAGSLFSEGDEDVIKMTVFGSVVLVGIFLERRYIHYIPAANKKVKLLQFVLGVVVLALLYLWPKPIGWGEILWMKCINYGLIALWVSFVYPLLLKKYSNHIANY